MKRVYVITNTEAGWDCVRGVYSTWRLAVKRILGDDYNENLSDKELESILDDKYETNVIHDTYLKEE